MIEIRYGCQQRCTLAGDNVARLAPNSPAEGIDPVAAMRRALARPLDLPPLVQATVPGDRAVAAIADGVSQRAAVALGVAAALCDAGVEPAHTLLLLESPLENEADFRRRLAEMEISQVQLEVHDPDQAEQMAFVGATPSGRPLRMNRHLVDADVAIPIAGCTDHGYCPEAASPFMGLFPQFGERADQERFFAPVSDSAPLRTRRREEIDAAGRLLGALLSVRVATGASGSVAGIFAGSPEQVARHADAFHRDIWTCEVAHRGDLAIAAVVGEQGDQTWDNLARALAAADRVLVPGGATVICTDLERRPGKAVGSLRDAVDFSAAERELACQRSADARAALVIVRALARGPVYLMSRLPPSLVESLGMTPVRDADELNRLVQSHPRCVVLDDAPQLSLVSENSVVSP